MSTRIARHAAGNERDRAQHYRANSVELFGLLGGLECLKTRGKWDAGEAAYKLQTGVPFDPPAGGEG